MPVKLHEIAEEYGFNLRTLSPAFTALTKVGILSSRVGGRYQDRGYTFAKSPKDITLYDIVRTLEGEAVNRVCGGLKKCKHTNCSDCDIYKEFQKVIDYRKKVLSSTTIYDLYERIKNL